VAALGRDRLHAQRYAHRPGRHAGPEPFRSSSGRRKVSPWWR
jgi:hypothetical protein